MKNVLTVFINIQYFIPNKFVYNAMNIALNKMEILFPYHTPYVSLY